MSFCAFNLYNCFSGGFKTGQRGRKVGGQGCEVIINCFKILACLISRIMGWFFFPLFDWVLLLNIFGFVFVLLLLLLLLLLSSSFVFSSILFVNLCSNVLYPFIFLFMPQVKDQQSHSLHLILAYFISVTTIFRLIVFKFYDFEFLLQNYFTLRKVSDNNLKSYFSPIYVAIILTNLF